MANEALINSSMFIKKGNLEYQSRPTSFKATVTGTNGPVPGAQTVPTTGLNISFTGLTTPGLCRIRNLDSANYVTYGIYDGAFFLPLGEVLAGEAYVIRLSRILGSESPGTGTGNSLRLVADTAACKVQVEAFEV